VEQGARYGVCAGGTADGVGGGGGVVGVGGADEGGWGGVSGLSAKEAGGAGGGVRGMGMGMGMGMDGCGKGAGRGGRGDCIFGGVHGSIYAWSDPKFPLRHVFVQAFFLFFQCFFYDGAAEVCGVLYGAGGLNPAYISR